MANTSLQLKPRWTLFVLLFYVHTNLAAQEPVSKEDQVKAVFLYNFTQFVQWPQTSFAADDSPLIIGILGEDPFGTFIDDLVQGEVIGSRPLRIKRFVTVEDITTCHILYFGAMEKADIPPILEALKSNPALTVSDIDSFTRMGGMIRFFTEKGHVRIRINLAATTDSELVVSSKLLRLSDIVRSKK